MNINLKVALAGILVVMLASVLSGCTQTVGVTEGGKVISRLPDSAIDCYDGVRYRNSVKRLAPLYNTDSTVQLCNGTEGSNYVTR